MELGLANEAGTEKQHSQALALASSLRNWLLFFYLNFNHVINRPVVNQKLSSLIGK